LEEALREIPALREEFWQNLNVPGSGESLIQSLERAGRVADFLELGELLCRPGRKLRLPFPGGAPVSGW
jgi:succinate dehydrogenase / fumarate reductase flavoprotein subunit